MDQSISRLLVDKIYEKRKSAALELEKQIRECHQQGEHRRISQIIDQLIEMFSNTSNALHVKNGGLIGLAGTAIALGVDVAPYMEKFIEPLLVCFSDPENRIRYFSAECLYNIAKVSKGEILVYFNPIFDALSKLAADSELSVKNGAELLDRLLKDIVAESASVYVPQYFETEKTRQEADSSLGIMVPHPDEANGPSDPNQPPKRAFSLARFIPLLSERIYVLSPFSRSFLVSWITVLDSVPDLELITFLPEFLDGLLKYLSDPTEDVRVATENLLADFLREIRYLAMVQKHAEEKAKQLQRQAQHLVSIEQDVQTRKLDEEKDALPEITMAHTEQAAFIPDGEPQPFPSFDDVESIADREEPDPEFRDTGVWIPGQGVKVDHSAIVEILLQQLDDHHDEIQQSAALHWLAEFLSFAKDVMVPFTPRLIPAILPNLAHHVPMILNAGIRLNALLMNVIQNLPTPAPSIQQSAEKASITSSSRTGTGAASPPSGPSRQSTVSKEQAAPLNSRDASTDLQSDITATPMTAKPAVPSTRHRSATVTPTSDSALAVSNGDSEVPSQNQTSRPTSAASEHTGALTQPSPFQPPAEIDPFDYHSTVNILTLQFLSEHEETRIAALKWLLMLHQKSPKKILTSDDGTFPALLKTLSDPSEDVVKYDLQLLAQISSNSEENYFRDFMACLLGLFSTDRRLLESRGSLIVRQLCLNLHTERIFRTLGEILEKEEDLEFASVMVQKLNVILITSQELVDIRRRLKSLETRQDGQALFITLYRSWCHNAVAAFSLCLLAQAYEHASNLLSIFADLEITVQLLVQVDKLVQLIESPVFTYLRLQLLEPERYPYLFKCLYGLLMLLPQSSAFVSLRNRLNAVNSAGFLHIAPRSAAAPFSARSKLGRTEDIKWQELLVHFRSVQSKHEKARRQALGMEESSFMGFTSSDRGAVNGTPGGSGTPTSRPPVRRRVTGELNPPPPPPTSSRAGALSPLNPRSRGTGGLLGFSQTATQPGTPRPKSPIAQFQNKQKRTLNVNNKS